MIEDMAPYLLVFASTLVATMALTPLVRGLCRRLGMVDMPDPRRINKTPIPRGGGIALVAGVTVPYVVFHLVTGRHLLVLKAKAPGVDQRGNSNVERAGGLITDVSCQMEHLLESIVEHRLLSLIDASDDRRVVEHRELSVHLV